MYKLLHELHLDLLDLHQPLPPIHEKMVDLLVRVADLQFGLEVNAVILLRVQAIPHLWRFWLMSMTGACMAARQERTRLRKIYG
jgi:hypothetical protein